MRKGLIGAAEPPPCHAVWSAAADLTNELYDSGLSSISGLQRRTEATLPAGSADPATRIVGLRFFCCCRGWSPLKNSRMSGRELEECGISFLNDFLEV